MITKSMFGALVTVAALLLSALPTWAATPPQQQSKPNKPRPTQIEDLAGHYRFVGGQAERDALEAAIDGVVRDMNLVVRGIARSKLREASAIPPRLSIALGGRVLTVTIADAVYRAPLDRSRVQVKGPSGDDVWLRHWDLGNGQLLQHFTSDDGIRVNTCRKIAGNRMRIHVTIHSDELPKDLVYAMTFARRPTPRSRKR